MENDGMDLEIIVNQCVPALPLSTLSLSAPHLRRLS